MSLQTSARSGPNVRNRKCVISIHVGGGCLCRIVDWTLPFNCRWFIYSCLCFLFLFCLYDLCFTFVNDCFHVCQPGTTPAVLCKVLFCLLKSNNLIRTVPTSRVVTDVLCLSVLFQFRANTTPRGVVRARCISFTVMWMFLAYSGRVPLHGKRPSVKCIKSKSVCYLQPWRAFKVFPIENPPFHDWKFPRPFSFQFSFIHPLCKHDGMFSQFSICSLLMR